MEDNRERRVANRDMLDITETDLVLLENAQRRKRHYYRILSGIEALIGLFSFIGGWTIGYDAPFTNPLSGYPFSAILMSGSIPSFFELNKKRGFLLLPAITLLIILLGLISGYLLGSAAGYQPPTYQPTAIKYNVYSKPSQLL